MFYCSYCSRLEASGNGGFFSSSGFSKKIMQYLGHSKNDEGRGTVEPLAVHLEAVAKRADQYMEFWGEGESGRLIGLLHDLGKYADQMQGRLRNPAAFPGRNHAAAGACVIAHNYTKSVHLALAVLYHHGGLKSFFDTRKKLLQDVCYEMQESPEEYTELNLGLLYKRFIQDFPDFDDVKPAPRKLSGKMAADMLDIRMAASALDDADFVETEAHFTGNSKTLRRYRPAGPPLDTEKALSVITAIVEGKKTKNELVRNVRNTLYTYCLSGAERDPGIFTLTAPTGSGKTLSVLNYALRHAQKNGLRRIVLVMPFLNIIDQTAKIYQSIFSQENEFLDNCILEDHSLSNFKDIDETDDLENSSQRTRKLLAENWDAPVILTTSVKFFESLHANRNSQLRKLHQLAKSVIIFDEAQSLPPALAAISLATLSRLADSDGPYGSSVVFATATQPAFETISPLVEKYSTCGWKPNSLIPEKIVGKLFKGMSKRVRVCWREQEEIDLDQLADELAGNSTQQILCIVNLKRHAQKLAELLTARLEPDADYVFHLSTMMCANHRHSVLAEVSERLNPERSAPVILISTQCVEAGVDISFPLVYRALAPLESIAQAAGRCNRHGEDTGELIVFTPKDDEGKTFFPPGYREGISVTRTLLKECRGKGENPDELNLLNSPDFIRLYYKRFFDIGRYDEERESQYDLFQAVKAGNFEDVAQQYKLIPGDMVNVLVPYNTDEFKRLSQAVQERSYMTAAEIRHWVKQAREHAVGLYRPKNDSFNWQALEPVQFGPGFKYDNHDADWFICLPEGKYDKKLCGLKLPENFVAIC